MRLSKNIQEPYTAGWLKEITLAVRAGKITGPKKVSENGNPVTLIYNLKKDVYEYREVKLKPKNHAIFQEYLKLFK